MARPRRDRLALLAEFALTLVVIGGLISTFVFLFRKGYLPHPYFYGSQSFFTDWSASAYYAVNAGAYDVFDSVYPPLSFVFLRMTSIHSCYLHDIWLSRSCDWLSMLTMAVFYFSTIPIVYLSYKITDERTAWMRTIAICLGLPLIYAIERGNLIVPTFFFFVLGSGRVLRSAWLRWITLGISINFKPYLILTLAGYLLRRRWRWFEGAAIAGLLVYLVTYMLEQAGDPLTVLTNIMAFSTSDPRSIFERSTYASSYLPLRDLLPSNFPLMHFIGSQPIEILDWLLPLLMNLGKAGIAVCFAGALWRPGAVPTFRLAALALSYTLTIQDPGGYAVCFLLFLVFMEPWRGAALITALVCSYILSISGDFTVLTVATQPILSYLTNQVVSIDLGVTVGMLARPGIVLIIQYALVIASLQSVWRARSRHAALAPVGRAPPVAQASSGLSVTT